MNCPNPNCRGTTKVVDSAGNDMHVYRKRKCNVCGEIFFTTESATPDNNTRMALNLLRTKGDD